MIILISYFTTFNENFQMSKIYNNITNKSLFPFWFHSYCILLICVIDFNLNKSNYNITEINLAYGQNKKGKKRIRVKFRPHF